MNRPLVVHPRADLDVMECFTFLARTSPAAARRFLASVEQTIQAISRKPDDGHRYLPARRPDEDWRYLRVPNFKKYLVFYRISATSVEVVRVVHSARDLEAIFRVL